MQYRNTLNNMFLSVGHSCEVWCYMLIAVQWVKNCLLKLSRLTSSFTCQLISIIITTLIIHHSFTLSLQAPKPTFSTNPSHLMSFDKVRLLLSTGLLSWQRDWTGPIMLIVLVLVSHFNLLFIPCGRLSWLPVSFLLHVKYTLSYRIVSYRRPAIGYLFLRSSSCELFSSTARSNAVVAYTARNGREMYGSASVIRITNSSCL